MTRFQLGFEAMVNFDPPPSAPASIVLSGTCPASERHV
jgi:hypothetical protein